MQLELTYRLHLGNKKHIHSFSCKKKRFGSSKY